MGGGGGDEVGVGSLSPHQIQPILLDLPPLATTHPQPRETEQSDCRLKEESRSRIQPILVGNSLNLLHLIEIGLDDGYARN